MQNKDLGVVVLCIHATPGCRKYLNKHTTLYNKYTLIERILGSSPLTWISSMLWTINMSCRSSMAPSIQLLNGAALLANSRCNWSIVSSNFSVLWRLSRGECYWRLNTLFKALRCANTCKYVSRSIKYILLFILAAAGVTVTPPCLWEAFSVCLVLVLGTETMALVMLGKCSTTEFIPWGPFELKKHLIPSRAVSCLQYLKCSSRKFTDIQLLSAKAANYLLIKSLMYPRLA